MKKLYSSSSVVIPEDVTVEVKARRVKVEGPRGKLQKEFKHLHVDLYISTDEEGRSKLMVDCHMGIKKRLACIRTVLSHINNMIVGVTVGFQYKMRLVYAHFPINVAIEESGRRVEIRNFLGEKRVRIIRMLDGVSCKRSDA